MSDDAAYREQIAYLHERSPFYRDRLAALITAPPRFATFASITLRAVRRTRRNASPSSVRTAAKVHSLLITNDSGVTTAMTISCAQ